MSLYDVIDEITERQATKTETGDTRVYGVMVGIVAMNYHPDMGGRICVTIPARDEGAAGWLIYSFEYACGLSGYLLEVNPFDQPGVEAYKNNMYALLGKPGYEEKKAELERRLNG